MNFAHIDEFIITSKRRKGKSIYDTAFFDIPLPKRVEENERNPVRKGLAIDRDSAMNAVRQVFPKRLATEIDGAMEDLAKKKKKLDEDAWQSIYKEMSSNVRVPRALLSQAESHAGYTPETMSRQLKGHGKDVVDEWNAFVVDNFDGHKSAGESSYDQFVQQSKDSTSSFSWFHS